jgi:hypothetical protein
MKYNILNEHTKNNETIQYIRQSQTKENEKIQVFTKKIKDVLVEELHKLKINVETSDLNPSVMCTSKSKTN